MKPVLHRSKLLIVTMALACGGLAASVAATQPARAATLPAAAMSAHTQPGSAYPPAGSMLIMVLAPGGPPQDRYTRPAHQGVMQ